MRACFTFWQTATAKEADRQEASAGNPPLVPSQRQTDGRRCLDGARLFFARPQCWTGGGHASGRRSRAPGLRAPPCLPATGRYSTSDDRPVTATMRAHRSFPSASVRRRSSPGMKWTGWGWPWLTAMLEAYSQVRSRASRMGFSLPLRPGSAPVSSGMRIAPPPGKMSRTRERRPSAGIQSCRTRAEKPVAAANTVIGRWLECRSRIASPCSSVVARFQVSLGNSARTSTPASGSPASTPRTLTTARAGLCSCGAAGMTRRTSASSITRFRAVSRKAPGFPAG